MPIKILRKFRFPTPFGSVEFPEFEFPLPHERPYIDKRREEALRHAVGSDIGSFIPWIGDVISDLHFTEIRRLLTREELEMFLEEDKVAPTTVALLKTFIRIRKK